MNEVRLKKIEELLLSITFNNKEYDYTYLFIDEFNMPILNPIPYRDEDSSIDLNRELKEKAGVYMLINRIAGDTYVGSSVDLRDRMRRYVHETKSTKTTTIIIHRALRK